MTRRLGGGNNLVKQQQKNTILDLYLTCNLTFKTFNIDLCARDKLYFVQ